MVFYIDPGTGSMLFTVLLGIIGAGIYSLRMLFIKLRYKLGGGKVETLGKKIPAMDSNLHRILASEWGRYNARHKKQRRAVLNVLPFAVYLG